MSKITIEGTKLNYGKMEILELSDDISITGGMSRLDIEEKINSSFDTKRVETCWSTGTKFVMKNGNKIYLEANPDNYNRISKIYCIDINHRFIRRNIHKLKLGVGRLFGHINRRQPIDPIVRHL